MTVESIIFFALCLATGCLITFSTLCYKRVFTEKYVCVIYVIIWGVATVFQLLRTKCWSKLYITFSLIMLMFIMMTLIVAYIAKNFLKSMFINLIALSFNDNCTSKIIIYRNTIISRIKAGYVIYDCTTQKLDLYKDLNSIVNENYRKLALKTS